MLSTASSYLRWGARGRGRGWWKWFRRTGRTGVALRVSVLVGVQKVPNPMPMVVFAAPATCCSQPHHRAGSISEAACAAGDDRSRSDVDRDKGRPLSLGLPTCRYILFGGGGENLTALEMRLLRTCSNLAASTCRLNSPAPPTHSSATWRRSR
jgi:hypothetical protein